MKSIHALAVKCCKKEGGKKEINIADMKQAVNVICEIIVNDKQMLRSMLMHGFKIQARRAKVYKRAKK